MEIAVETERPVRADPGRLLQVLLNLGGNALDAMEALPKGGLLRLVARDAADGHVAFVVEDSGLGIPPEVQARLFEPFLTTKGPGKGTGLGLHLVGEIVTAMSGRITWESRTGEGTRFRVEIPVAVESIQTETRHDPRRQDHSDRGRSRDHSQGAGAHVAAGAV
jgi:signal transduction histidine kinase